MDVRGEMNSDNRKFVAGIIEKTEQLDEQLYEQIDEKSDAKDNDHAQLDQMNEHEVSATENENINEKTNKDLSEEIQAENESEDASVNEVTNQMKHEVDKKEKMEKSDMKINDKKNDKKPIKVAKHGALENDDIDLAQAEVETEKTINHINKRLNQQEETETEIKRDFTGLLLMFALIFSFGAMAFSIVNVLAPSGLNRTYYEKGVKFLNEKNTERLQALKQELIDSEKASNKQVTDSLDEIRTALVQVSDNIKKLNQNMAQVQANISSEISNQATPDLSQFSQSLTELKSSIHEIKHQMRLINANSAFKPNSSTENNPPMSDVDIQYVGVSPNGAILKISDKDKQSGKGGNERYITVKAGQMTAYGEVSFLDDQSIVINGKRMTRTLNESK